MAVLQESRPRTRASLASFHPLVRRWFADAIGTPTPAQTRGWAAIRDGRHTLIAAPTGSGKTLAAFLIALDDLLREGLAGPLPDEVRVVYVSPLKALSSDIHKNLAEPRGGIRSGWRRRPASMPPPHHRRRPHRRHLGGGARGDGADAAAHPRHDAGVALPAAHRRAQPRAAAPRAHGHRRRDPRGDRHPTRRAPGAVARAAGARQRRAAAAHRPVGDAAAGRGGRPVPRRRGQRRRRRRRRLRDRRRGPSPRTSIWRSSCPARRSRR